MDIGPGRCRTKEKDRYRTGRFRTKRKDGYRTREM